MATVEMDQPAMGESAGKIKHKVAENLSEWQEKCLGVVTAL